MIEGHEILILVNSKKKAKNILLNFKMTM